MIGSDDAYQDQNIECPVAINVVSGITEHLGS